MASYKGKYKPVNPKKYMGDTNKIIYRSLLERKFFMWADRHPDVLKWASEEFSVRYISPKDNRPHKYFPDVFIKIKKADGTVDNIVIEIKPKTQTVPPKKGNTAKSEKRYIRECLTYGVNTAKWKAAEKFCAANGLEKIQYFSAENNDWLNLNVKFNLCYSFLSIGFHWPIKLYLDKVYSMLTDDALLIFGMRSMEFGDFVDEQIESINLNHYSIIELVLEPKHTRASVLILRKK